MKRQRILSMILAATMMFSLVGCSNSDNPGNGESKTGLTAGTYEVTTKGHNADIKFSITTDETSIKDIQVIEHSETEGLGDSAMNKIIPSIISNQTVAVDTIAGATVTSEAILSAVSEAIVMADGSIEDFNKKVDKPQVSGEAIEKNVDVVVVGAGAAGMAAAVEAGRAGASVLVLEKMPKIGGNTAISSGNIYATGSKVQDELGLTDDGTVDELAEFYMKQGDYKVNEDWCQLVAEKSGETLDWLVYDIGVSVKHRSPESSHRSLISETSGVGVVNGLAKVAEANGTEIMLETAAKELIVENGAVVGIVADNNGNKVTVNAKSVILATGGYDGKDESKEKYAPGSVGHHTFSNPGNVGDSLEMVEAVDGKILLKGGLSGIHLVADQALNSPLAELRMIPTGVGVTDLGYRYADESMPSAFDYYNPMVKTGRKAFFNIVDSTTPNELLDQAVEENAAFKADTIEELAKLSGIPEYTLKTTIEEYNAACLEGTDKEFNKNTENMKPLITAPYYAVKITPNTNGSFGGIVTNLETEVMNVNNDTVKNLYAAGAVANGELFYLRYPVSGSSISMTLTFGRIAGQKAAANAMN